MIIVGSPAKTEELVGITSTHQKDTELLNNSRMDMTSACIQYMQNQILKINTFIVHDSQALPTDENMKELCIQ